MRHARLRSLSLLSAVVLAACTSATPGWTYAPAPIATPVASSAASGTPSGAPSESPNANVITISAFGSKYEQTTVTAPADTAFQLQFENKDPVTPHNVAIRQGGPTGPELFNGEIFNGVATKVYDVPALPAGTYGFVCTVHVNMIGTLNAQ